MENKIALVSIMVCKEDSVESVNSLLHEYREHIIGRMGIPRPERGLSLISVALDAPQDVINALTGKLGALSGVAAKTVMQKTDECLVNL